MAELARILVGASESAPDSTDSRFMDPAWQVNGAERRTGSCWEHWANWAERHSGEERPAPNRLGGRRHRVLVEAPGLYVRDQVTTDA
jgi:poly(3-hydroxyalkanoate) synthetase